MRRPFYIFCFLNLAVALAGFQESRAQTLTAGECIKLWKEKNGYHQQEIINDLFYKYDRKRCSENLNQMQEYLTANPKDVRISANALIYDIYHLFRTDQKPIYRIISSQLTDEIKKVYPLQEEYLTAWLYFVLAEVSIRSNYIEEALFYNLKAIDIFERLPEKAFIEKSNIYHSITRALYFSGDYDKSLEFGEKCSAALTREGRVNSDTRIYNYDFLFSAALKKNDLSRAEKHLGDLQKAIQNYSFPETGKNEIWQGVYNSYTGQLLEKKGDRAGALEHFNRALPLAETHQDKQTVIDVRRHLGSLLYDAGQNAEAEKQWLEAFALSQEYLLENSQQRRQFTELARLLSDLYRERGDYNRALKFYEIFHQQSSLLDEQVSRASYRVAQVNIRNDALNLDIQKYSNELRYEKNMQRAGVLIFLILLTAALFALSSIRKCNQLKLLLKDKERQHIEHSLKYAEVHLNQFKEIIVSKNNIINELSELLPSQSEIKARKFLQRYVLVKESDWENFRVDFNKTYPLFFATLKNRYPEITPALLRLSALIYMGLTNDEIANSLSIDKQSVARSIRRLRHVFHIKPETDLLLFLQGVYRTGTQNIKDS